VEDFTQFDAVTKFNAGIDAVARGVKCALPDRPVICFTGPW